MDRTMKAVTRQLKAMSCSRFEVGVTSDTGMILREWDLPGLLKSVPWLKHSNFNGSHVYVRPFGSVGLIMLDDLTITSLDALDKDGLIPSVVCETSPLNYQAWLRFSEHSLDPALATALCQVLASAYNTDPASADWRHFGRLAGFTNRKPAYIEEDGRYPFVLLRKAKPTFVKNVSSWLEKAELHLSEKIKEDKKRQAMILANRGSTPRRDANSFYLSELRSLESVYSKLNVSKADWMIAIKMASRGYDYDTVANTLLECSPDIDRRKLGHVADYITRTLDKIYGITR